MVIEPIFEKDFAAPSYGFRPGRGCKDGLRRVDRLLKAGYTWVVDADLKSYFETIRHERLMDLVGQKISEGNGTKLSRFSSIFSAKIEEKDCTKADFMEAFVYENLTTFPTRF